MSAVETLPEVPAVADLLTPLAEVRETVPADDDASQLDRLEAKLDHVVAVANAIGQTVSDVAPMLQNPSGLLGSFLGRR